MRVFEGHLSRCFFWPAVLVIFTFAAGCQTGTRSLFTATGAGWRVQQGQALWRPRHGLPELAGDLVAASHPDGRCLIEFVKTPLPLVSVQTTPTQWLIQFPPRRLAFSGKHRAPARFAWLYLHAALAGEPLPAALRFERRAGGSWRLENRRTGETLDGFLGP